MISLCFLLALVILLMQKAANPRVISDAFDALGVPLETPVELEAAEEQAAELAASIPPHEGDGSSSKADSIWLATCDDLSKRLLSDVSNEELQLLLQSTFAIFKPVNGNLGVDESSEAKKTNQVLLQGFISRSAKRLLELQQAFATTEENETTELWLESFARFEREWDAWGKGLLSEANQPVPSEGFVKALSSQLDILKYRQLANGSPWRPSESVAFKRLLQTTRRDLVRSPPLKPTPINRDPVSVGTLQLEAEFDQYHQKLVSFRGSVRRIEWVEKAAEDFGINDGYWLLWLRGADNGNQPVAVYSASKACQQLADSVNAGEQPKIEVLAYVGKRLAYSATSGVEVTPTLFASSMIRFIEQTEPTSRLGVASPERIRSLTWTLATGGAVAALVLLPIIWTWKRKNRVPRSSKFRALLLFVLLTPSNSSLGQTIPPWAEEGNAGAQVRELLRSRMDSFFNPLSIAELSSDQNEPANRQVGNSVPTAVLQLFDAARKIGWKKTLDAAQAGVISRSALVKTVEISGRVVAAEKVELTDAQEVWFQTAVGDDVFRLEVDSSEAGMLSAYVANVPAMWLAGDVEQPISLRGLAVQPLPSAPATSEGPDQMPGSVLSVVAPRVAWPLAREESLDGLKPEIPEHWVALGRSGWDLAWLDVVAKNSKKPIGADESAALLSLLKVAPEIRGDESSSNRMAPIDAMRSPTRSLGKPLSWRIRAVEGAVVRLNDSDDRELLGDSLYYQINGFVDLEGSNIRFQLNNSEEAVVFEKEFPITILLPRGGCEVPAAVENGSEATWEIGQYLQVEGVFYRLWSFDSELIRKKSATSRQAAPLVIGTSTEPTRPPLRRTGQPIGWFSYALCAAILVILASILWLVSRKEERRRIA